MMAKATAHSPTMGEWGAELTCLGVLDVGDAQKTACRGYAVHEAGRTFRGNSLHSPHIGFGSADFQRLGSLRLHYEQAR